MLDIVAAEIFALSLSGAQARAHRSRSLEFSCAMAYDANVVAALVDVELSDEIATSLATKLKTKGVTLQLIAGLSNDNVTVITDVMLEQVARLALERKEIAAHFVGNARGPSVRLPAIRRRALTSRANKEAPLVHCFGAVGDAQASPGAEESTNRSLHQSLGSPCHPSH